MNVTVIVNPNSAPTCSLLTANPTTIYLGSPPPTETVSLSATANDPDGTIASYTWSSIPSGGTFSSQTSTSATWTPPSGAGGVYAINHSVTDDSGTTTSCPSVNVSVKPSFTLTVNTKLKPAAASCGGGSLSALVGASVWVDTKATPSVRVGSGPTNSSGVFTASNLKRSKQLNICVTYAPVSGCVTYTADCPLGVSMGCIPTMTPPATGDSSATYEFYPSQGEGWVTAINGGVEAATLGNKMACLGYTGELSTGMDIKADLVNFSVDGANTNPKAYVFSSAASPAVSRNNILEDTTRGGWAFGLGIDYSNLSKLKFNSAPGAWFNSSNLNAVGTVGLYQITMADFNTLTQSGAYTYTLDCGGCRAGILYVKAPDPIGSSDKVLFNNAFNLGAGGSPVLIITALPVEIANTVGVASAGGTFAFPINKTPNINAAIITSDNITVKNEAAGDGRVIMLAGPFVSLNQIAFNRDVKLLNSKTPAEAVRYNNVFLCEASKLEKAHPEVKSYTGLGMFSVQWRYSE
jgi:hypothetical protein